MPVLQSDSGICDNLEFLSSSVGTCELCCTLLTLRELKLLTSLKRQDAHGRNLEDDCLNVCERMCVCVLYVFMVCYEDMMRLKTTVEKCRGIEQYKYEAKDIA